MGRTSNADQRLMDAALYLLWEESYGFVTIDDICKRADVRKGSFYHFFGSKSDLAVRALDRMWVEYKPQLDEMFAPSIPPMERIRIPAMPRLPCRLSCTRNTAACSVV